MYYDYYIYYLSYLSSLYNGYPLIIRGTVVMVMLLIGVVLFGIIRLFYLGYKINKREKLMAKTKSHFADRLSFVLESTTIYEVNEIKELLGFDSSDTKKWKQDILTELVLSLKSNAFKKRVLNDINYKNCLEALHLMVFWEKKIRRSDLNIRREALQILGEINNGVNSGVLSKSTYHSNTQLRKTARDVYTSQDTYMPFRFMEENFDESFTHMDKLRLHSTLIKRSKEGKLPNLLRWINNSRNPNYTIFIIREIAFFRQSEALPTLIEMLRKQENRDIRARIVVTLGEFGCEESVEPLITRFSLESGNVREAIIHTMGLFQSDSALEFLKEVYISSPDVNFKLRVARSIMAHGCNGEKILNELNAQAKTSLINKEVTILNQVLSEQNFQTI